MGLIHIETDIVDNSFIPSINKIIQKNMSLIGYIKLAEKMLPSSSKISLLGIIDKILLTSDCLSVVKDKTETDLVLAKSYERKIRDGLSNLISSLEIEKRKRSRIIIDKEGYVTLDDCAFISKIISNILDSEDPIKDSYILDVCSKEKECE